MTRPTRVTPRVTRDSTCDSKRDVPRLSHRTHTHTHYAPRRASASMGAKYSREALKPKVVESRKSEVVS